MELKPGKLYELIEDFRFLPENSRAGDFNHFWADKGTILFCAKIERIDYTKIRGETGFKTVAIFLLGNKLIKPLFSSKTPEKFVEEIT